VSALEYAAWILAIGGGLVNVTIALAFLRDPVRGLAQANHRAEFLPQVMTDRYVAFVFLTIGALVYGDLLVIAWLFAAYALMSFADTWIYARAGHPAATHTLAGAAATLVVVLALAAEYTNGTT